MIKSRKFEIKFFALALSLKKLAMFSQTSFVAPKHYIIILAVELQLKALENAESTIPKTSQVCFLQILQYICVYFV